MIDTRWFERFVPLNALRPAQAESLARKTRRLSLRAQQWLALPGLDRERQFLLTGTLDLYDAHEQPLQRLQRLQADTAGAAHALQQQCPQARRVRAATDAQLLICDAGLLDVLLTWDPDDALVVGDPIDTEPAAGDWMHSLLLNRFLHRVPPMRLQALFLRGQRVNVAAGEVLVRQNTPGDDCFLLIAGRAAVLHESAAGFALLKELDVGAMFGEDALLSDEPRNATVRMIGAGQVLKLAKRDFRELLKDSVECRLDWPAAAQAVEQAQARWLDVRLPSEFALGHLPGAFNLPLPQLRQRLPELAQGQQWIVCCDTGRRSAVAAFHLVQNGLRAAVLDGGLPQP